MCFHLLFRVLEQIFVSTSFWEKPQNTHFSSFLHQNHAKTCKTSEKADSHQHLEWLSFFNLLSITTHLHPPTKIPVLNDQLWQVQNCRHDLIQVALFHAACCKKIIHMNTTAHYSKAGQNIQHFWLLVTCITQSSNWGVRSKL